MRREWLINSRQQLGLTQDDVAKKIGISRSYYNQIETGERTPSGAVAFKVANLYGFDMNWFYKDVELCATTLTAKN